MFKNLLIVLFSIYSVVAQAQTLNFGATSKDSQSCAKQIAQNVIMDSRFADLNNLVLYPEGVLISGMNQLGIYSIKTQDKNGFDYLMSFYVDLVSSGEGMICRIGNDKNNMIYPFSIIRSDNNEKIFDLQCLAQGKAANCL